MYPDTRNHYRLIKVIHPNSYKIILGKKGNCYTIILRRRTTMDIIALYLDALVNVWM